jgi:multimeric flavodoxin WrbA
MNIIIVYHSGYGHTGLVAEQIAEGARRERATVTLLAAKEASTKLDLLTAADTIVFGSPTYFANVSAEFKAFMEATGAIYSGQRWKNKLAAGFTNSSSTNGDKLHTLVSLSLFAAQQGMLWIPLGILPRFENGIQQPEPNGMASYLGLMTMSDNVHGQLNEPADLGTARQFGRRIAQVTRLLKAGEVAAGAVAAEPVA